MNWYELKVKTLKIQRRIFADKEKELTKAYEESKLPDKVDKNALSELQKEIFKQRYRKKLILNV